MKEEVRLNGVAATGFLGAFIAGFLAFITIKSLGHARLALWVAGGILTANACASLWFLWRNGRGGTQAWSENPDLLFATVALALSALWAVMLAAVARGIDPGKTLWLVSLAICVAAPVVRAYLRRRAR
jgi:hypothetical protein